MSTRDDGFPGERLRILPEHVINAATSRPITRNLLVTDVGWFPRARDHGRRRPHGTPTAVVMVCAAGRGWCQVSQERVVVRAGQALVIPSHLPHSYGASRDDPWSIAWMHVSGDDLEHFETAFSPRERRAVVVDMHDPVSIQALMEDLMSTLEVDDTTPSLMRASGTAAHVLAQLAADHEAGPPDRHEPVRLVLSHLRTHFHHPVVVSELASMAGVSRSHFAALFRQATGCGVVEYVKRLRMARASELLLTTELSVSAISRLVGYQDPLYFSRQFRSVHGLSPSSFRRQENVTLHTADTFSAWVALQGPD